MSSVFTGTLTSRDCKRHIPHAFVVPPGAGRLEIDFAFAPHKVSGMLNLLTLTLFGPDGCRGAGHRHGSRHEVHLSAGAATPGYVVGPLPPGEWTVQIDTHMIMPGAPVAYSLEVRASLDAAPNEGPVPRVVSQAGLPAGGPGWFRGDLHCHTVHSDGRRTAAGLVAGARAQGLDFVFLTDHNTTAGLAEMDALSDEAFLATGGMELTTFFGHALVLGAREWVDWRIRPGTGEMARIASDAQARGRLFVIAHPFAVGDPLCTGCRWRYGDMMPGTARLVEVWNGPWESDGRNPEALALYYDWLNQGLRLVATAGTDSHHNSDYERRPAFSVIRADRLTEPALLDGLRAGHAYLTSGPTLALGGTDASGAAFSMGDAVSGRAAFSASWSGAPEGAALRVIADGKLLDEREIGPSGAYGWEMTAADARWVTVELRDERGRMAAFANPMFLEG